MHKTEYSWYAELGGISLLNKTKAISFKTMPYNIQLKLEITNTNHHK
jgi:hypothetical protein